MLNEVLHLLEQEGVFSAIGVKATQKLVLEILQISKKYDCNAGEILEDISERLSICRWCLSVKTELTKGICASCRAKEGWEIN